jgi:hypothetical protein
LNTSVGTVTITSKSLTYVTGDEKQILVLDAQITSSVSSDDNDKLVISYTVPQQQQQQQNKQQTPKKNKKRKNKKQREKETQLRLQPQKPVVKTITIVSEKAAKLAPIVSEISKSVSNERLAEIISNYEQENKSTEEIIVTQTTLEHQNEVETVAQQESDDSSDDDSEKSEKKSTKDNESDSSSDEDSDKEDTEHDTKTTIVTDSIVVASEQTGIESSNGTEAIVDPLSELEIHTNVETVVTHVTVEHAIVTINHIEEHEHTHETEVTTHESVYEHHLLFDDDDEFVTEEVSETNPFDEHVVEVKEPVPVIEEKQEEEETIAEEIVQTISATVEEQRTATIVDSIDNTSEKEQVELHVEPVQQTHTTTHTETTAVVTQVVTHEYKDDSTSSEDSSDDEAEHKEENKITVTEQSEEQEPINLDKSRELWTQRIITNLEYLLILNRAAGRTTSDKEKYIVLPWTLNWNTSDDTVDINESSSYRNLSTRSTHVLSKELVDSLLSGEKLSSESIWTTAHKEDAITTELPFDFYVGKNDSLNKFQQPKWATSPREFVSIHRAALESSTVSNSLHNWIDNVFGVNSDSKERLFTSHHISRCKTAEVASIENSHIKDIERIELNHQQVIIGLETQLETLDSQRENLSKTIEDKTQSSGEKETELVTKSQLLSDKVHELNEEIKNRKLEHEKLEVKLQETLSENQHTVERIQQENEQTVKQLESEKKKLEDQLETVRLELNQTISELSESKNQVVELQQRIVKLEQQIHTLEKQIDENRSEHSSLHELKDTKESELVVATNSITDLEKQVEELEEAKQQLSGTVSEKESDINLLNSTIEVHLTTIKRLEEQIATLEQTIAGLEEKVQNLTHLSEQQAQTIQERDTAVKSLETTIQELRDELQDRNDQIVFLKQTLENRENIIVNVESDNARQVSEIEKAKEVLDEKVSIIKKQENQLEEANVCIANWTKKDEENRTEIKNLWEKVNDRDQTIQDLQKKQVDVQTEYDEKVSQLNHDIERLNKIISDLEDDGRQKDQDISGLVQRNQQIVADTAHVDKEAKIIKSKAAIRQKQIEELRIALNIEKQRTGKMEKAKSQLVRSIRERAFSITVDRDSRYESMLKELEKKYNDLHDKHHTMMEDRNHLKKQYKTMLHDSGKKNSDNDRKIKDLTEALKKSEIERNESTQRARDAEEKYRILHAANRQLNYNVHIMENKIEDGNIIKEKTLHLLESIDNTLPEASIYAQDFSPNVAAKKVKPSSDRITSLSKPRKHAAPPVRPTKQEPSTTRGRRIVSNTSTPRTPRTPRTPIMTPRTDISSSTTTTPRDLEIDDVLADEIMNS